MMDKIDKTRGAEGVESRAKRETQRPQRRETAKPRNRET